MKSGKALKTYTLDQMKDEFIGKRGTQKRDVYEAALSLELLGNMIRTARLERNLTQQQLGALVGVQKAQISKLEKSAANVTVETVLRIFHALHAKVNLRVELQKKHVRAA